MVPAGQRNQAIVQVAVRHHHDARMPEREDVVPVHAPRAIEGLDVAVLELHRCTQQSEVGVSQRRSDAEQQLFAKPGQSAEVYLAGRTAVNVVDSPTGGRYLHLRLPLEPTTRGPRCPSRTR